MAGLEPTTSSTRTTRASQLRYTPTGFIGHSSKILPQYKKNFTLSCAKVKKNMDRAKTFVSLLLILLAVAACGVLSCTNKPANTPADTDTPLAEWGWKEISEGLSYTITHADKKDLLVVKIDPRIYAFSIYENKNPAQAKTIEQIHNENGSLLSFNGGFFTEDFTPTGLLISEGVELRPLSGAELLNGVIAIRPNGESAFFHRPRNGKFPLSITPENYSFAIQNGPALIDEAGNMLIDEDSGQMSSRTAMGFDRNGDIILIILKQSLLNPDNSISLYKFSEMIQSSAIFREQGVHSVLNLDGGSSTGLMIDGKYFPEMEKVQNVVLVKAKI